MSACTASITLSQSAARALLAARAGGSSCATVSTDLNRTRSEVKLCAEGVRFHNGPFLKWAQIERIAEDDAGCYRCTVEGVEKIQRFSEATQRVYTLYPTTGAPTLLISGVPMHRIKGVDPRQDTLNKLRALGRIHGQLLDTCTGLGYTALEAARDAEHVITIELDPAVHEIIRQNPWSCMLFETPNITALIGDSAELIETFAEESFDFILHDPPMFTLAGELYSLAFYRQLHRVLRRGGRLFHYIGNPESKSGATVTRGAARRLTEAGFRRVQLRPQAFGLIAFK